MNRADKFIVKENITLAFESKGNKFEMQLCPENGLVLLDLIKGKNKKNKATIFLNDKCPQEHIVDVIEKSNESLLEADLSTVEDTSSTSTHSEEETTDK